MGGAEAPPTGVAASVTSTFGKTLAARDTSVQGLFGAPGEQKPGGKRRGRSLHIIMLMRSPCWKSQKKKQN